MKSIAGLCLVVALASCKSPPPVNPADFVGCYYSNSQTLPSVKITETRFEVPELRYADTGIEFQRIKGRNLIWLSSPYGVENVNGALRFANLGKHTNADKVNYELTRDGLVFVVFPAGNQILFAEGPCG